MKLPLQATCRVPVFIENMNMIYLKTSLNSFSDLLDSVRQAKPNNDSGYLCMHTSSHKSMIKRSLMRRRMSQYYMNRDNYLKKNCIVLTCN